MDDEEGDNLGETENKRPRRTEDTEEGPQQNHLVSRLFSFVE